jgi:multidrug efflux pump
VGLNLYQLPGTNALDVADRVRAKMKELKTRFPDGIDYDIAYDTTPFIRESIREVFKTLRDAVLLVGLVVLFFLQDWRTMILPMIDVPVSLIGTFGAMAALGFTLNNLTLFGLVLAIGIVVDDAIVVLENTERMIAKGFDARTATIKAMEEITGPIIAITLALSSVFVPCCFLGGITGQFFRQFAVTIAVSTIISAINALTMTPSRAVLVFKTEEGTHGHEFRREALPWWAFGILGGLLTLRLGPQYFADWFGSLAGAIGEGGEGAATELSWTASATYFAPGLLAGLAVGWLIIRPVNAALGWLFRGFNGLFDRMTGAYGWMVGKSLRISLIVLLIYGGLVVLTYDIFRRAPLGFIPEQDQGRLILSVQLPDSASLQRTQDAMEQVEAITREDPGVAHTVALAGMSFLLQANASNFGSMFVVLKPFDQRQAPGLHADDIMARLRKQFARRVKDAEILVRNSSAIPGLGVAGGYKLIVEDRGGRGLKDLQQETDKLVSVMQPRFEPGLAKASTQFRSQTPQLYLEIDRIKAQSLGLSFEDVNQTLSMCLGSLYVNSYNQFGRHWQVTVQLEGEFRNRVEDINLLQVRNKWGEMVPLGTLVRVEEVGGPISVTRYNLYRAAQITGTLAPGISSGETIKAIDRRTGATLPLSMKAEWTEVMFLQIRAAEKSPPMYIFALSVVSVFLALAALYESWALPLAVILVVPMCLLCSLAGVLGTGRDVNIFVQIGLVVLVGLACKNAILIVEYARQKQQEGQSRHEATLGACRLRLRPILMTSIAFIIGVIPLAVASGAGAEMRRSLGIAVFYGMVGVTLFGIFLTPVFFSVIQGLGQSRPRVSEATRWVGSTLVGGLAGLGIGFLLARLDIAGLAWGLGVGGPAGLLVALAVLDLHRRLRPRPAPTNRAPHPRPKAVVPTGDQQP